ncbi:MAG: hypothetical protein JKY95_13575, partial [Planctomycetaceae bacterium]|nr:hypothetical protein [Planctomycetaceae bacterium]
QNNVFVVRDGNVLGLTVQQQTKIQSLSLIESGLQPGDQVILTNLDTLKTGDLVNVSEQGILTLEDELKRLPFPILKKLD